MPKQLIMGFGTNQSTTSVRVFLRSARKVYSEDQCDIVLITNDARNIADIAHEAGATLLSTSSVYSTDMRRSDKFFGRLFLYPFMYLFRYGVLTNRPKVARGYWSLLETWHHPHFARWYAYERVFEVMSQYEKVLLADTKDVVFQAPFFHEVSPGTVHFFQDSEDFRLSGWNGRWYRDAYGTAALSRVAERNPLCIGVMMGDFASVNAFVREFAEQVAKTPFGKIEQAIFNHFVFCNLQKTPYSIHPNYSGAVATLGDANISDFAALIDGAICGAGDRRVIPVAHMYDRHPTFREAIEAKY